MSDNLIESVAPHLAAPVTREPVQSATEHDGGTEPSFLPIPPLILFADDDAE